MFVRTLPLVLLAVAPLVGCKEGAAPAAPPKAVPTTADRARVETEQYVVALSAGASEGTVTITAKAPLHINPDYPTAFRPDPGAVTFDTPKVPLAQETKKPCAQKAEDTCESSSSIKYASASAGAKVSGTVLFSVCQPEKCLIEKAQVTAAIP
jgi:hypothetical protein